MKRIELVKTIGGIIVSVGVGAIVGNVINHTTPNNIGIFKKVCIAIGSLILTSMVGDKAVQYTEEKVTNAVKSIEKTMETGEFGI